MPKQSGRMFFFPSSVLYFLLAIIVGSAHVWLLTRLTYANPWNLGWLNGDSAQYQVGWEFLRREPSWEFPPTWLSRLNYPNGISASYLDVIPLVAVPLRLLAPILPYNIQYLGAYALVCCVLQAFFGFKLTSCFSKDWVVTIIGGLFFLICPILSARLQVHFSLCSQWLIVASLYYYFRPHQTDDLLKYLGPFVVLSLIAGGTTPYIALMVSLIGISALGGAFLERRFFSEQPAGKINLSEEHPNPVTRSMSMIEAFARSSHGLWLFILSASTILSLTLFGFIDLGKGMQLAGDGYTVYSMNLLSPLDPVGTSNLIPSVQVFPLQRFEGYNYLGMGIILLGILTLVRKPALNGNWFRTPFLPLLVMGLGCTLLAISLKVTIGQTVLFTVPVPAAVYKLLAVFRSSGRLFWPVHYLIILAVLAGTIARFSTSASRRLVLGAALILQYVDILPVRSDAEASAPAAQAALLTSKDWSLIPLVHRHLTVLPSLQCDSNLSPGGYDAWSSFAMLAATNSMTLNSVYAARSPSLIDCAAARQTLSRTGFQRNTAYVLSDPIALSAMQRPNAFYYCRKVDGLNLCTYDPEHAQQSSLLLDQLLPPYKWGTEFRAEAATPASMAFENLDPRPAWCRWTIGRQVFLYIRPSASTLRVDLEIGYLNLNASHTHQRTVVRVNGKVVAAFDFKKSDIDSRRSIIVPQSDFSPGRLTAIMFEFPDAVAPSDLGINDDNRLLAIGIRSVRITPFPAG